jgi:alkanesulfonate monooxygenase SsuD/methylene tetrahydromethanopterin reductase-like flavin-dependent oxidoreductase (luciferase family)
MRFGAHLPLMDFGGHPYTLEHLVTYTETAVDLGFDSLAVNDHMVFSVPWLDGPTALAAVLAHSGDATLTTTVSNPVVRGPVALAKTLGAIDRLSGGRLVAGVGPGSSERDYEAVGLPFAERWKRFEEAILVVRALWQRDSEVVKGRFYSTEGIELEPMPAREGGPPIWIGAWGSEIGLRRTARLGDGWLASAYNTTPTEFAESWRRLGELLVEHDRRPEAFANGLATMWFHITDDRAEAERVLRERVLRAVNRPEEVLRERLPLGPAETFADRLASFRDAGVQQVFLWPVTDEINQLHRFAEEVAPLLAR